MDKTKRIKNMKEEIAINTQLALFFDKPIERPDELFSELNKALGGLFTKVPIVLPLDIPDNNFPIVQAQEEAYVCNIAKGRVDFIVRTNTKVDYGGVREQFRPKLEKFFGTFRDKTKRIGFVTNFFIEDEKPGENISNLINKDIKDVLNNDANSVHQAQIVYSFREKIEDFQFNNYTSIQRMTLEKTDEHPLVGINIIRDFNTIPENNYLNKISYDSLNKILDSAENKFNLERIKKVLWPDI